MNLQLLCNQAVESHRRGDLAEAERLYLQILAVEPGNFTARHMFGVLRSQQGRNAEALELIGAALKTNPASAFALSNYGNVLQAMGRFGDALWNFDKALAIDPKLAGVLCNRGNILQELKRFAEALSSYDRALAIRPDYPEAHYNRGLALWKLKRGEAALASYDRALALRPAYAEAHYNRGLVLSELKRFAEALASYDKALAIRSDYPEAWNNRGNTLRELKRFAEALASYEKVLVMKPGFAEGLNNRGIALWNLNRFEEALASYEVALALKPDYAEALNNRGTALGSLQRFEDALASYDIALANQPDSTEALYNRGEALRYLKRFDEAFASYEQALAIDPDHPYAFGGAANALLNLCGWPGTEKIAGEIEVRMRKAVVPPFTLLGYGDDAALQLQCAKDYVEDKIPVRPRPLWNGATYGHERIRIAYLSADFHEHATAYLMAELFERHDRARFAVTAISFGPDDGSAMRARLVKAFDDFHDVRERSDEEVARLLRASQIDIAVDLKGHTQDSRMGILGHRPCPVQVNYLGYPGTMGADFIDYVIADPVVVPFDRQPFFTEKIVHLPDTYQPNDSQRAIADAPPSRAACGLPGDGFVFCCFNNSWKIAAPVFELWMRLLAAMPGSVLWLIEDNSGASARLRAEASARGIDPQRLVFAARVGLADHLARHRLADLFLDTLPYNAHTTASDALWAGLPLLTCKGASFAGRVAASLLGAVGLPELATDNLADYEALALALACDPARLQSLRQKLAANRSTEPLFDTDRFRRNIEAAYTRMWELAERGEPPRNFAVGHFARD